MKFSTAVPLAMLASTIAAQGYPGQGGYQGPPQGYGQGGYQGPPNYGGMQGAQQSSPWPNIPDYEVKDWQQCTNQWLNAINIGQSGSAPVCTFWQCLTDTANKYNRGKVIAAASTIVDNFCKFGGGSVLGAVC